MIDLRMFTLFTVVDFFFIIDVIKLSIYIDIQTTRQVSTCNYVS